ncbi:MAG: hypothetical protein LBF93_08780, partial [Zoogloeaceae bacterium]|nr:hypothetical protein [Zoogloeaceae bacterium]
IFRSGSHLILTWGESDSVTIQYHYSSVHYQLDRYEFADGKTLTLADLQEIYPIQVSGGYGFGNEDDNILGLDTNDSISGGNGNDTLRGGAGSDALYGNNDNDTLDGGTGNDYMEGNAGDDAYVVRKGSGQDNINNYDTSSTAIDTLRFEDVNSDELTGIFRSGNHLILTWGESDSVTIQYHYNSVHYQLDRYEFADGKTLTLADLQEIYPIQLSGSYGFGNEDDNILGLDTNDTISGGNGNDTIRGGAGSDVLYGNNGDDVLEGGIGNDRLEGGAGDDVYLFSRGDGGDVILDTAGSDVVRFGEGITAEQLWFSRQGQNLEVAILGTDDKLTLAYWYNHASYQVEQFRLDNGAVLKNTQAQALVDAMREARPPDAGAVSPSEDLLQIIGIQWETPEGEALL